ncbi:hypothetical protein SPONN_1035 [uncultured Candidatus Thioglobus sp.]|nr:hypothetical protein SPONN_1035 [uncultured Candidatus Thioglobus sp.]
MNNFEIKIKNIQSIKNIEFSTDLSSGKLICIVGKNGAGKTTLIKSIATLLRADIFQFTSSPYIFQSDSEIVCQIDNNTYTYTYDNDIKTINSSDIVENHIIKNIVGELPLPYGQRFNFFQKISKLDKQIRQKYISGDFKKPENLIKWYQKIYSSNKFDELKEVTIAGKEYYFLPQKNNRYIREDYFSSGEYFVLNIYRLIQQQQKLIVIDELDISLDASAQVHLIGELRFFCKKEGVTLLFTSHSLAVLKTLKSNELFYLENNAGQCEITKRSYNYIKGVLYQFTGWDKYILTEDIVLLDFIKWQLNNKQLNKEYIIIPIGSANSVIALMDKNSSDEFFSIKDNVISVLDADQTENHQGRDDVIFSPFKSIEKKLKELYDNHQSDTFFHGVTTSEPDTRGKDIWIKMKEKHSQDEIFQFVAKSDQIRVEKFKKDLQEFINR